MRDKFVTGKERLEHILQAINNIEKIAGGLSEKRFLKDVVLQSAILFQFAVIGEAIIHIDHTILDKYDYPWHYVRAFRNFVLHEYHAIEMWVVWDTIIYDIPELKKVVISILNNEFER